MTATQYDIANINVGPGVSRVSIRGTFGFPILEGEPLSIDLRNVTSPTYVQSVSLASGANTITKPASAGGVVIVPPQGNTSTLTLKGVTGDTGVRLHTTAPSVLTLDVSVSTFVLTAGAAVSGVMFVWL